MSKYTTEVRFICEMKSGYDTDKMSDYTIDQIIAKSRPNIFNFEYPIFDSAYKPTLEHKILKHYYFREICCETFELWRSFLNATLNDIMPKYNALYKYQKELYNKLFNNIDVTTNAVRTDDLMEIIQALRTDNLRQIDDGHRYNEYGESREHTDAFSDTPQGSVTFNQTSSGNVWLTDFRKINDDVSGHSNDTSIYNDRKNTGTQENDSERANTGQQFNDIKEQGYRGGKTFMELVNELNDKFINIDLMIIEDLSVLFFRLW